MARTKVAMDELADYHNHDGERTHLCELEEGDSFVARVSWYDSGRPNQFTVTRPVTEFEREVWEDGNTPMAEVKAEGSDGETYKFYIDNQHVECTTDDGKGYDRGTMGNTVKLDN